VLPLEAENGPERPSNFGGHDQGAERFVVDRHSNYWFERCNFGGLGGSGNMAVRRRAFELCRGFDERIGPGRALMACEDLQLLFSLVERGYCVVYSPDAVVHHPEPESLEDQRAKYLKTLAASAGYMTLLFLEQGRYRDALIRYAASWLKRERRPWRVGTAGPGLRLAPRWRELLACLHGPLLCAHTLLQAGANEPAAVLHEGKQG
jgi:GT2 family glycosyltransferase